MTGRTGAIITIVVTAIVNVINLYGYSIDADTVVKTVLSVASAATILWSWWRNNDMTEAAFLGTGYTRMLKAKKKAAEKGEKVFEEDPVDPVETEDEGSEENAES